MMWMSLKSTERATAASTKFASFVKTWRSEIGPTPTPCNECDVCQRVTGGDDVDVLEIDGASNRGIDEIRQLRQNVAVRDRSDAHALQRMRRLPARDGW